MKSKIFKYGILSIILVLNACTFYNVRNDQGFAGRSTSNWGTSQRNFERKQEIHQLQNENESAQNVELIKSINQAPNPPKQKSVKVLSGNFYAKTLKPANAGLLTKKQSAVRQLEAPKTVFKKTNTNFRNKLQEFLPSSGDDFGYWAVFILFSACVLGAFFSFLSNALHPGNWADVLGIIFLVYGLIYYIGLKDYHNLGINFVHDFGYITTLIPALALFGIGIPILMWIIGSLVG